MNVPHQFFKVHGIGDAYSPKNVSLSQEQRYQNVRIIAVYETDQIPALHCTILQALILPITASSFVPS